MAVVYSWDTGALNGNVVKQNGLGDVYEEQVSPTLPSSPQLVRNNDFELGNTGWKSENDHGESTASTTAHSGSRVMRIDVNEGNRYPISERFATVAGWTYAVRVWFRRYSGPLAVSCAPLMATWDSTGARSTFVAPPASRISVSSTNWVEAVYEFTVPAGAVEVAFAPWAEGTSGGVIDADDIDVRSTSAFPQRWLRFDQVGPNNICYVPRWDYDLLQGTLRAYLGMPTTWGDASCHIIAWQTSAGPTQFMDRITMTGDDRPGRLGLTSQFSGGELALTNPRTLKEDGWIRLEMQMDRNGPNGLRYRARLWRIGSDIAIWDTGWHDAPNGNRDNHAIRLGLVQYLGSVGMGHFKMAHIELQDTLTTIGRHSTDTLIPPHHRLKVWDQGVLRPAKYVGVWDGSSLTPATEITLA